MRILTQQLRFCNKRMRFTTGNREWNFQQISVSYRPFGLFFCAKGTKYSQTDMKNMNIVYLQKTFEIKMKILQNNS